MKLEICIDTWEALESAIAGGADRIELCASLSEGGLTPPYAFIEKSLTASVPCFVMIRPRGADFLYTSAEIELMHRDIYFAKQLGVPGIVLGVLNAQGSLDMDAMRSLVKEAAGLQITCHRCVDQADDIYQAVEDLISLGVHRVLTSGGAFIPHQGMPELKKIVELADDRIKVMAAGVNPGDVREIIETTGVHEVHSAAMSSRKSEMEFLKTEAVMGSGQDFVLNVVDENIVRAIKANMG